MTISSSSSRPWTGSSSRASPTPWTGWARPPRPPTCPSEETSLRMAETDHHHLRIISGGVRFHSEIMMVKVVMGIWEEMLIYLEATERMKKSLGA